ncbi:MAG: nickel-dependent lactate racemase [Actinobacteria bacterium]|nr:nickel-dependent lactate racemase [Actinomycetota bacterium]
MNINLDYGNSKLEVNIPDKNLLYIIENRPEEALTDPKEKLIESLKRPIGTLPLKEKIKDKSKVCIVISDITRAVPTKLILEALLPELLSYGVNKDSITILIGTGLHRPNEGEELVRLVGKDIAENYNIVNHNAKDRENCRQIGETKVGTPIILNKVFLDSDFRILTGLIEPHFMAGFSGGRKAICPGISYVDMFKHFHGPEVLESPNASNAILSGNPFHEESTEIAKKAGVDFIVNVTINKNKEITGVFSGDLEKAFLAGATSCQKANIYNISKEADIVITSAGGFPLDINLYQAVKGMVGALPAVKKGGMIIIVSQCREGVGSREFLELLTGEKDLDKFTGKICESNYFKIDQWELEELAKARRKAEIYLYSEFIGGDKYDIPPDTIKIVESVKEAIGIGLKKYGKDAKITVIPQGPYVIPLFSKRL